MGAPAAGSVVLVRFPFSDLSRSKLRPAVVLADAGRGDAILCQVTSKSYGDDRAVAIAAADLAEGSLRMMSFARPGKIFTANETMIAATIARPHGRCAVSSTRCGGRGTATSGRPNDRN